MFEIPTLNQLVVQIAWLGLDEDAVNETELRAHTVVPRARMQRCQAIDFAGRCASVGETCYTSNDRSTAMEASTKDRLLEAGMAMLLEHGYSDLGIQQVLTATAVPKGSFYHHFKSKEDFALQAVDLYMTKVHAGLDACLGDQAVAPLKRVRGFFEATGESYGREGYLGCLLGGLGQELSGANEVFRSRIERCFSEIATRITSCLEEAKHRGDLRADTNAPALANLLVDCWEGAALRTRLLRDPAPLLAMLDFYFQSLLPSDRSVQDSRAPGPRPRRSTPVPTRRAAAPSKTKRSR